MQFRHLTQDAFVDVKEQKEAKKDYSLIYPLENNPYLYKKPGITMLEYASRYHTFMSHFLGLMEAFCNFEEKPDEAIKGKIELFCRNIARKLGNKPPLFLEQIIELEISKLENVISYLRSDKISKDKRKSLHEVLCNKLDVSGDSYLASITNVRRDIELENIPIEDTVIFAKGKPAYDFKIEPGNFFKNAQLNKYRGQFFSLLESFRLWGVAENIPTPKIMTFYINFFNSAFTGNQSNEYFAVIKQNLEDILFILKDESVLKDQKVTAFTMLCANLDVCGPGLFTHIEQVLFYLKVNNTLDSWLAHLRTNLIQTYAINHIKEYKVTPDYEVHVHNDFLREAIKAGFAPLSKMNINTDPHAGVKVNVSVDELKKFRTYFQNEYPKAILNFIIEKFEEEYHLTCQRFFNKSFTDAWRPYSLEFMECIDLLVAKIGKPLAITFFDFNADSSKIKFNREKFTYLFLLYCWENKYLFQADFIKSIPCDSFEFHYLPADHP